jgi:hypothetical protein
VNTVLFCITEYQAFSTSYKWFGSFPLHPPESEQYLLYFIIFVRRKVLTFSQKLESANRKYTNYKSTNHKKRLDPQIAKSESATFAEGPQMTNPTYLRVPKREIFLTELSILSVPIWKGKLRAEPKKKFV